jgi:hypothetical protein
VTFNSEVTVIGDGSGEPVKLQGDKLSSMERCTLTGQHGNLFGNSIGDTEEILCGKLMALEETGPTALGPALVASVSLACEGGVGSKVIICTDGIANIGLGSLEDLDETLLE